MPATIKKAAISLLAAFLAFTPASGADPIPSLHPEAVAEAIPLVLKALEIQQASMEREARHRRTLAKRGIAEQPPSPAERHTLDIAGFGDFAFDEWGEFYIDRRFLTDEDMHTIRAIERWFAKWFPGKTPKRKSPRSTAGRSGLPVFRGFEHSRYQLHDELIAKMAAAFNADKAGWCGGTPEQAAKIPDIAPALVKSHMIEESGGNGRVSLAAWDVDPLQVNVPGDWGDEKKLVGLAKPLRRNEGSVENNVRAAIMYLARKGFSAAALPASERPKGYFDGWKRALQRYNGRRDRTATNRHYSDEYADKILRRAANPDRFEPIEIKLAKSEQMPPSQAAERTPFSPGTAKECRWIPSR